MKSSFKSIICIVFAITLLNIFAVKVCAGEMSTYAEMSYDQVMQESASSIVGRYFAYDEYDEDLRQKCNRFLCLEKPSATAMQQFYVYAIIDIDGSNPTTATYTTSSGSRPVKNNNIAVLAYISAMAEINHTHNFSYAYSKAYSKIMNDSLRSVLDPGMPYGTDAWETSPYVNGVAYRDSIVNGTASVCYSARVIIFQGGSMQTTAILYGKEGTNGSVSVNKYITNSGTDRSSWDENRKHSNPAEFDPNNAIVNYNIVISSTYQEAVNVTVADVFQNNGANGGLKAYDISGWIKNSENSYSRSVTVPANGETTVTISLKTFSVYEDFEMEYSEDYNAPVVNYSEEYYNTATISGSGISITKSRSSDYVHVGLKITETVTPPPSGSLEKYVSKVNGVAVSGRSNRSNDDKYEDPVVVSEGDDVEYTLIFKNTSNEDIYRSKLEDKPEDGLDITRDGTNSTFSANKNEVYTTHANVTVNKSNLYLYNLENDLDFVRGYYTKRIVRTGVTNTGQTYTYTIYQRNTPLPASTVKAINNSNMDKDYVRLKELIIAGYVWLDSDKNGLMGDSEHKFEDYLVKLHNVTDKTVMSKKTDENGHFEFSGFYKGTNFVIVAGKTGYYPLTAVHKEYYLEYYYDGVRYIPTEYAGRKNLNSDNSYKSNDYLVDSNATEYKAERDAFNDSLETIAYNKGLDKTSTQKVLEFDKSGHESHWVTTENLLMKSYSFVSDPVAGTKDNLFLSKTGKTDYLEHINLGLLEREKLDLRVTKDLVDSDVRINGYELKYEFGKLVPSTLYDRNEIYKLYIYDSDYSYRYDMYKNDRVREVKGLGSELQVDLTFKITVYNESPDTTFAKVNELIDYYTDKMTVKDGSVYMTYNGSNTPLSLSDSSKYNGEVSYSFDGYRVKFITGMDGVALSKGESFDIYMTYSVDKDANRSLYLGEKANIAQISAYSSYEDVTATKAKGLIDIDSNAGNVNKSCVDITDIEKYEDNVFRVRVEILLKPEERKITGFVFEDTRSNKVPTFNQFVGNGLFTDGANRDTRHTDLIELFKNGMKKDLKQDLDVDTKLDGMTVELIEIIIADGQIFEESIDPAGFGKTVVRTQTADGKYEINSFIPSTYIVRFRYGDIFKDNTITENSLLHNGQDYKSTAYTLTNKSGEKLESSASNDEKYNALVEPNRSDARDNEYRRIEVMAESEDMIYDVAEFMKYTNYAVSSLNDELREFVAATNAFADTVTVSLGIENKADTVDGKEERVAYRNFGDISLFMPNVDYGVVFRPENFISLNKKIKSIKLETSAGNVLVDIQYDMDGNVTSHKGSSNVQSVDTINNVQGFRYINVDEDILQGAKLSVEYYIIVNDIGEVDTVAKFLIEEGGSRNVLSKLNEKRNVIKSASNGGMLENYSRFSSLVREVYSLTYSYGLFVGDVYYSGIDADLTNIEVVPITVHKILDFIDNDATFVAENNITLGKYWATTNENVLRESGLIGPYGLFRMGDDRYYKDELNRRYVTTGRSNLVVNVPTYAENPTLIIPMVPEYYGRGITSANIVIEMNAILGGDTESKDMVYENIAEIVEFITPAGRRTNFAATVGNIKVNGTMTPFRAAKAEVDSDGTEVVRLTPPTGMTRLSLFIAGNQKTITTVFGLLVICVIIIVCRYSLVGKVGKTKFYK